MSTFAERQHAFLNYFVEAIPAIFENHPELCLSIDASDATQKLISLIKVRDDLSIPTSIGEAYLASVRLLVELIGAKKIAILSPLSTRARAEWNQLLAIVKPASTEPAASEEQFADVIQLYRTNPPEFNNQRKVSPRFRERSDRAQELHLLTPQPLVSQVE
jgi:hypothetical protein